MTHLRLLLAVFVLGMASQMCRGFSWEKIPKRVYPDVEQRMQDCDGVTEREKPLEIFGGIKANDGQWTLYAVTYRSFSGQNCFILMEVLHGERCQHETDVVCGIRGKLVRWRKLRSWHNRPTLKLAQELFNRRPNALRPAKIKGGLYGSIWSGHRKYVLKLVTYKAVQRDSNCLAYLKKGTDGLKGLVACVEYL